MPSSTERVWCRAAAVVAGLLMGCACSPAADSARTVVEMRPHADMAPGTVHITAGDAVIWTNGDDVVHRIGVPGTDEFLAVDPGDVASIRFDHPGTFVVSDPDRAEMMTAVVVAPR